MATKHVFIIFLLLIALLSHNIHARDVKMFNKIPSKINENVVLTQHEKPLINTNDQQPNFIPQDESENSYGLYGHESGQLPPSTTTETPAATTVSPATTTATTNKEPLSKYLPKNYNPVSYVTEPEDFDDSSKPEDFDDSSNFMDKTYTTTDNNNNNGENNFNNNGGNNFNNNGESNYYNGMKDSYTTTDNNDGNKYYNNGENNNYYNSMKDSESTDDNINNYYYNNNNNGGGGNNYNVPQKGMSDTRFTDRAYTTTAANNNNNNNNDFYNNGATRFVEKSPANNNDFYDNGGNNGGTSFMDKAYTTTATATNNNDFYTGERVNRVQQQGMSDTRFLHNGRYFYDIEAEKYSLDPYENSKQIGVNNQQFNTRGFNYNNGENSYQNNNYMEGQEQYQDEEDLP